MNIIIPKNKHLYSYTKSILDKNNVFMWRNEQYKFDDLIINVHLNIRACIQIDPFGYVVDGFVNSDFRDFKYQSKSFYELLGGDSNDCNYLQLANPISFN